MGHFLTIFELFTLENTLICPNESMLMSIFILRIENQLIDLCVLSYNLV